LFCFFACQLINFFINHLKNLLCDRFELTHEWTLLFYLCFLGSLILVCLLFQFFFLVGFKSIEVICLFKISLLIRKSVVKSNHYFNFFCFFYRFQVVKNFDSFRMFQLGFWNKIRRTRVENPGGRLGQVFAKIPCFQEKLPGGPPILGFIAFFINNSFEKFTWGDAVSAPLPPPPQSGHPRHVNKCAKFSHQNWN
jgi:hypothetical protein